ncbi:MAG: hypothetical protein OEQ28_04735, partial [Acidobacteriota bacterium]|nr:hypothetical protein [Acidobacteriota bacterium]
APNFNLRGSTLQNHEILHFLQNQPLVRGKQICAGLNLQKYRSNPNQHLTRIDPLRNIQLTSNDLKSK